MGKYIFMILLLIPNLLFSQNKELKKAIKKGENSKGYYTVSFNFPYEKEEIVNWCNMKGYVILETKEGNVKRFGDYHSGIVYASFMEQGRYQQAKAAYERERAEARRKADRQFLTMAGFIMAGGYVLYQEVKKSNIGSANTSNYSGGSTFSKSNSGFNVYSCKNGEIEILKREVSSLDMVYGIDLTLKSKCAGPEESIQIDMKDNYGNQISIHNDNELSRFNNRTLSLSPPVKMNITYAGGCELTCPWDHCKKIISADISLESTGSYSIIISPD